MDNRCTVCNHSRAHDINLALLAGATLDHLKQQFGLSRSALHRHKQHLQRTIDRAEDRLRHNFLLSYLFQLNDYHDAAAATVAAARAEGNARLTLQAANAGARIVNAMARFGVDLDHETIYRLLTSPEYVQSGCLLPSDPQILAGPRQTLVRSLAAACPETGPDILFDPEDLAAYLKLAQEPDANTPLPQSRQLEFPGFLVPLADLLPAGPEPTAPHAGPCLSDPSSLIPDPCLSHPESQRDRSGTEAGQTTPLSEINEEIQLDIKVKISETNLNAYPASDPLAPDLWPLVPDHPLTPDPWSLTPLDVADAAPKTLDEAQAAELAEYLANFSPYTDPAPGLSSDPLPSALCPLPTALSPPARRSGPPRAENRGYPRENPPERPDHSGDLNFGNPGLFKQMQGTFI
jgi:hypothetical protein